MHTKSLLVPCNSALNRPGNALSLCYNTVSAPPVDVANVHICMQNNSHRANFQVNYQSNFSSSVNPTVVDIVLKLIDLTWSVVLVYNEMRKNN